MLTRSEVQGQGQGQTLSRPRPRPRTNITGINWVSSRTSRYSIFLHHSIVYEL